MPLPGVIVDELQEQLRLQAAAEHAEVEASRERSLAISKFIHRAVASRGRVVEPCLKGIVLEFYE